VSAHARRLALEGIVVAGLTVWVVVRAASLPAWDRALGTDWVSYLRNAMAVGSGHWEAYNVWRGPLYSWLLLALLPIAGTPLAASKVVSIAAAAAAIPATWALGRAIALPGAVWGAALLALWPDLPIVAHFSTMYPLLMALLAGGAALAAGEGRATAVGAGMLFGLAGATDLRGAVLAACFLAAVALSKPSRLSMCALSAATGALLVLLILTPLPVTLLPLEEQIATQAALGPVARNVHALAGAGPHVLVVAFLLAPLAMIREARSRLPILVPPAVVLAALAFVPLQLRYFLPVAPFVALLAAAGLSTVLVRPLVPVVVALLCVTWRWSDDTMMYAFEHGAHGVELGSAGLARIDDGVPVLERAQKESRFDRVVDCSALDIVDVLFFPTPVDHPSDAGCATIARTGVSSGDRTLLLTSSPEPPDRSAWRELERTSVQDPHGPPDVRFPLGLYVRQGPQQR
jgi:hypothetical protein